MNYKIYIKHLEKKFVILASSLTLKSNKTASILKYLCNRDQYLILKISKYLSKKNN